ncbi:hypothetical protein CH063_08864 [Colletotrichum higginsianum]|uniref:Uncharacterized protein n=1 Tax=Colletotrichum higginsianum (strain IMI 349063) TaxID=759273 RepID=H1VBF8_COLHI|nr:hypothetical protein CH063_08864 [Colletotrichum higginsianum]
MTTVPPLPCLFFLPFPNTRQRKVTCRDGNIGRTCQRLTDTRSCYPRPIHLLHYHPPSSIASSVRSRGNAGEPLRLVPAGVNSADLTSYTTTTAPAMTIPSTFYHEFFGRRRTYVCVCVCVFVCRVFQSRPLLVEAPKPYIFNYTSAACAGVRSPAARLWAATFLSQMSCSFRFQSPLPSPGRN